MPTHDINHQPLHGLDRYTYPLHQWVDHHPVPFLTGTDGLTWRQRRRRAERYAAAMTSTPEQRAESLAWGIAELARRAAAEEERQDSSD